jgi:hypothetical protein
MNSKLLSAIVAVLAVAAVASIVANPLLASAKNDHNYILKTKETMGDKTISCVSHYQDPSIIIKNVHCNAK